MLLSTFLLAFSATSSFAAYGWGDTMETAEVMYYPGGGTYYQASVPLESSTDNDWYVINNDSGSYVFDYYVILTPPAGKDLQLQIVRTDANNNIISVEYNNYGGPGQEEGRGWSVLPGEKHFYRVMPVGLNDYDPSVPYKFEFRKTS